MAVVTYGCGDDEIVCNRHGMLVAGSEMSASQPRMLLAGWQVGMDVGSGYYFRAVNLPFVCLMCRCVAMYLNVPYLLPTALVPVKGGGGRDDGM